MAEHNCPKNKTSIRSSKLYTGCEYCLPQQLQQGDSANFNRRYQQTTYRKELTQPVDPRNFIKAYPDKAREMYGDDTLRKYS